MSEAGNFVGILCDKTFREQLNSLMKNKAEEGEKRFAGLREDGCTPWGTPSLRY